MAIMDAKDILGLPRSSFPILQEKKSRPPPQRRPDGVSREVYALTGGLAPPLMPSVDALLLKPKPQQGNEKITWQWLPFTSSARTDNLQLYHWVRVTNGVPPTGDYAFAKYNKSVDVVKYSDEEYEKYLVDPNWTKEETDQLIDLCGRFDLRFIIIADRFPTARSVEELKSRYYTVYRSLLIARAQSPEDVANHPLVKERYNPAQEAERKRALASVLTLTKQQEQRETEVLAEAKRIAEARSINKSTEGTEPINETAERESVPAVAGSSSPSKTHPSLAPVVSAAATTDDFSVPASLRMLRVYLRTFFLDQMVQTATSSAGLRTIKRVDQTLQDLGVDLKPKVPTKAVCIEHLELRKEILTLLNLQKQLQSKEVEASANREIPYAETPGTPKRPYRGEQDQNFIPEASGSIGEKAPTKDHKRKVPGRFTDAPPSPPQQKRPRKL